MLIQLLPLLIAGLVFQEGDRRALLSTEEPVPTDAAVDTELRLYDIGHLVGHGRLDALTAEVARSDGMLVGTAERERLETVEYLRGQVQSTGESVSRAIRDMLEPAFDEDLNIVVPLRSSTLAVIATAEQHGWLDRFFGHVSAFDGLVDIQTRIYMLQAGRLAELGQERSGEVLSKARVPELLQRLESLNDGEIQAPRVVVYPFQQAELTAVEQYPYIQDFELKILQDVEIVDPVIGIAESGVHLQLRCIPLASGQLSIDAHIEHSTVAEPIPTVETSIGARGQRVTIQLPEITAIRLQGRFDVASGETLAMASTDPDGGREVLVLVRAVRVEALPEER